MRIIVRQRQDSFSTPSGLDAEICGKSWTCKLHRLGPRESSRAMAIFWLLIRIWLFVVIIGEATEKYRGRVRDKGEARHRQRAAPSPLLGTDWEACTKPVRHTDVQRYSPASRSNSEGV